MFHGELGKSSIAMGADDIHEEVDPAVDFDEQSSEDFAFVVEELTSQEKENLKGFLLKSREETRSAIAKRLITLLGVTVASTIILSVVVILAPSNATDRESKFTFSKDVFSILLSTQTGLIGAALGFYFGSKEDG